MAPKLRNWSIIIIEQGGIAKMAFDSTDGTIDSITATVIFSYYKLNSYREAAKE